MYRILPLLGAALFAMPVSTQGLTLRDPPRINPGMVAYDIARHRLVELGRHGEVIEFDGTTLFQRPGNGPNLYGRMVYRAAAGRTFAYGIRFEPTSTSFVTDTAEYDGTSWRGYTLAVQPAMQSGFGMSYDSARDRVVLFGGIAPVASISGETWEWDGAAWSLRSSSGPSPRLDVAMAFDNSRNVTVMFGGRNGGGDLAEHWEWDGSTWLQRSPPVMPPARHGAAMTFDPLRGRVVMFGGWLQSTTTTQLWEFDGTAWLQVVAPAPPPRADDDDILVFDARSGTVMLAGQPLQTASRDYWRWNGSAWQQLATTPVVPGFHYGAGAAVDPIGGGAVLFGHTLGNDTWRFDSGAWSQVPTVLPAPAARSELAMWSDGAQAWMFGGLSSLFGNFFSDTWRWNGVAWLPVTVTGPSARAGAAVAFDSTRNQAVLFGGRSLSASSETWTFNGTSWLLRSPATVPPVRSNHALAYDPVRDRMVMFGGRSPSFLPLADTWEWNGSNWSQVSTPHAPTPLGNAALVYDPNNNRIVLSQAIDSRAVLPAALEMWSYDGVDWTRLDLAEGRTANTFHSLLWLPGTGGILLLESEAALELVDVAARASRFGVGCGPAPPSIAARDLPTIGNPSFGIDLVSATPSSLAVLAGSGSMVGQPLFGCTLYLGAPQVAVTMATNAAGFATRDLPVPSQPSLLGTQWYFQGLALQPGTPGDITMSAALAIVIGS